MTGVITKVGNRVFSDVNFNYIYVWVLISGVEYMEIQPLRGKKCLPKIGDLFNMLSQHES
jgi:hypothetical protein